ncbi:MAG: hypothetical protein G3M70_07320 [Candidatus Nitronauta litoralis]|uniref:Tip attachment protein J domain-containing protein n=1 Tax=Candidatus Nitronauta litoralis TaxID=2705533 RepID=A0A7T0BVG1_9BACT|nr:MAG: hypothetical protein G3M70_07320 [Candidatus Nitronauta litoralis]
MRTFSSGVTAEKNKSANEPVSVLKMVWPVVNGNPAITLYFSDRTMTIGVTTCIANVINWAEVDHLLTQGESAGRSIADSQVELSNAALDYGSGVERFSELIGRYPLEAATATLYQWFGGASLDESDLTPLLVAECEPVEWNEQSIVIDMTLISSLYGEEVICRKITTNEYPNAPESSIGQRMPIIIGTVPGVKAIPVRKANRTEVSSIAKPGDTTLDVRDTSKFPSAGSLLLGEDAITFTGKTATQFTGCSGINTLHFADEEVIENISDFRCLCFDKNHPISAITQVRVGEDPDNSATIDLPNGEVVFSKTPRKRIGVDTRFQLIRFDAVEAGTTALNPANALTLDDKGVYATLNKTAHRLWLRQTDAMGALGEMGKTELRVEHFAEEKYNPDFVKVIVNGQVIGNLSKPGDDDKADVQGTADEIVSVIDNLDFPINVPTPTISASTDATRTEQQFGQGGTSGQRLKTTNVTDPMAVNSIPITFGAVSSGVIKAEYSVSIGLYDLTIIENVFPQVHLGGRPVAIWTQPVFNLPYVFEYVTSFTIDGPNQPASMNFTMVNGPASAKIDIINVSRTLHYNATVWASQSAQNTNRQGGINDVNINANLNVSTEKSTNGIVDLFDITSIINNDWNAFTNMLVEFEFTGSSSDRNVFVIGAELAQEFHTARYQATDQVFVDCVGLIDDGAGTVTGTPNAVIETVPDFLKWSVIVAKGLPASTIHTASFDAAATKFTNAIAGGYKVAGVIDGETTFDDLWAQCEFEARCQFFFDAEGKARLIFRPKNNSAEVDGEEVLTVTQGMVKLADNGVDMVKFTRTPKTELANTIDLKYARDYFKNAWSKDVSLTDAVSVGLYGKKEKHPTNEWELWFCRSAEQAQNVGEFWMSQLSAPSTLVEIGVSLKQMELERADIVKFDHPLGNLSSIFSEVLPGQHIVGSGRDQVQDHVMLALRLFPVAFLRENLSESIGISESLIVNIGFLFTLTDNTEILETLLTSFKNELSDSAEAQDVIEVLIDAVNSDSAEVADLFKSFHFTGGADFINSTEKVRASDGTGWGTQKWGNSYYGGSEVLVA